MANGGKNAKDWIIRSQVLRKTTAIIYVCKFIVLVFTDAVHRLNGGGLIERERQTVCY